MTPEQMRENLRAEVKSRMAKIMAEKKADYLHFLLERRLAEITGLRYKVGKVGDRAFPVRSFKLEDDAAAYIATLPGFEDGIYYLDDMLTPDAES